MFRSYENYAALNALFTFFYKGTINAHLCAMNACVHSVLFCKSVSLVDSLKWNIFSDFNKFEVFDLDIQFLERDVILLSTSKYQGIRDAITIHTEMSTCNGHSGISAENGKETLQGEGESGLIPFLSSTCMTQSRRLRGRQHGSG